MCSPETWDLPVPWTLFRWWKLRPHTWSLERSTRWLNFPWKFFNSLNVQTSFSRIRWMRSSPNAWAAAKIGCRDLKKSRKAKRTGKYAQQYSTASFFMPTEVRWKSDWKQGGVQQLCDSNFNAHRWQRPFRGLGGKAAIVTREEITAVALPGDCRGQFEELTMCQELFVELHAWNHHLSFQNV